MPRSWASWPIVSLWAGFVRWRGRNLRCGPFLSGRSPAFLSVSVGIAVAVVLCLERTEPYYDKLMQFRLDVLRRHGMGLPQIQEVIADIQPVFGAKEFLDDLRVR